MLNPAPFSLGQDLRAWAALLVLPLCYVVAALWARESGGAFWLWYNLDPSYFYLLDALNVLNLTTPGVIYHPGTPVQWLGALILKIASPFTGADVITNTALAEPEAHLRLISTVLVLLNGAALMVLGRIGYRVFGGLAGAILQLAPVISMVVLKNSYLVKPEALLLFTMLVLTSVSVLSLDAGLLERRRNRFAVAFGIIAGFGVATKITALPVFLLPLFVLWGRSVRLGAVILYVVSAVAALILFTLPAAESYVDMISYFTKLSQRTGAYGGGAPGIIDLAAYPQGILKMFKRPAFHVVFILAVVMLLAAWRRRRDLFPPAGEVRLLAGILVSQMAHVLLVAKQPNAMYMIPSFVLIPLAFVLVWRLGERLLARRLSPGVAVLLVVLVAAQAAGVSKLARELEDKRTEALSVDAARFGRCARIYAYAASSRSYALLLGDYVTGSKFAGRLAAQGPDNDYWLEHWWDQSRLVFRGWRGPEDMPQVLARYPCSVFRGSYWKIIDRLLPEILPGVTFDADCSAGKETILTRGVGCDGRLLR